MKSKIVILVFVLALSGAAQAQTTYVVLEEDFEGSTLGASPEEAAGTEGVWTNTPPPGWFVDNSGVPGFGDPAIDGVTDWAGWAFTNKEWWTQVAGDQRRSEYTLGQNTVAVADPDEWDDSGHPPGWDVATDPYDTWLSTPAIDISRSKGGTVQLKFDSSWRPEYDSSYRQTANITVSFDGAEPIEVLLWESDSSSMNFKDDNSTNETIIIHLDNPAGAQSMVLTFGLFDAGNDWWWAIDNIMVTAAPRVELASNPNPPNRALNVPYKTVLSWTPGEYVGNLSPKHKVILSDNFDDVKNGTAVVNTQNANSYDAAGLLDFSTTYYWRIDEANSTTGWDEGGVWQFTVEPLTNPIDGNNITATASSAHQSDVVVGPENTINGSGLDANDLHSTEPGDMWLSGSGDPGPVWIEYELDKAHKLHEMWVWNTNQMVESIIGFGLKDVTIEYSTNGTDYTILGTTHEFARAPGAAGYAHNTTVDFGSAAAKYVRLTANSNWGGIMPQYGLGEVRFFDIPVHAKEPSPDSGATDVAVGVTLGFRAGREAVTHDVYLSTDEQAVIDGNVPVTTVTEISHGPLSLDLGTTYYWKINEVNEADTTTTWQGDTWNFTTQEFLVVDDFEDYGDYEPDEIWRTWVDGYGVSANGATVGYPTPDWNLGEHYVETTIVHGGSQTMPLFYSNTGGATYSEGKRTFAVPQDWTAASVQTLALYFRGSGGNTGQLYVEINGSKVVYDGDAGDIQRAGWQAWNIELASFGTNLQGVTTMAIGIDGNGAIGTLYFDDFRLYSYSPEFITPTEPSSVGLIGHWKLDGDTLDSSGLGNHGTANGGPTYVAGQVGQAMSFDGDDYVAMDGVADDITNNDITLAFWVNMTSDDDWYPVISCNTAGGANVGWLAVSNGYADFGPLTGSTFVTDNDWHHLAYTRIGDNGSLYVDGVLEGTHTPSFIFSADNLWSIGQEWDTGGTSDFLIGTVDDARIYDYGLSFVEIAWLTGRTEPFAKPF